MAQIMIVEDNQGTNKAICEYLKTAGHTLFPALDGEEALNIFRDNSIDLAVLDIMLPKMSGVTILHEIRKISNIPVVMLTAVDDEYTQSNSFDELADDYIFEPFYRPNRARNPANGGNGLGLYIVKTILDKQGLQYCFTSMKSKTGMEFVIYF